MTCEQWKQFMEDMEQYHEWQKHDPEMGDDFVAYTIELMSFPITDELELYPHESRLIVKAMIQKTFIEVTMEAANYSMMFNRKTKGRVFIINTPESARQAMTEILARLTWMGLEMRKNISSAKQKLMM